MDGLFLIALIFVGIVLIFLFIDNNKRKKEIAKNIEYNNSNIDRDRICLKNIEPVYMKYAEEVTLKEFHKDYKIAKEQDRVTYTNGYGSNSSGGFVPNEKGGSEYVTMHGTTSSSSETIVKGGYTREFLEAQAELCRKYKKLFFDENENVKAEIYNIFDGHKNKEFDDIIIEYIKNNEVVFD